MNPELPYSQASENNRQAIAAVLRPHVEGLSSVLEIGGGTGQHAVYFSEQFPWLQWQSSDITGAVDTLNLRIHLAARENLPTAVALDVDSKPWQAGRFNAVFTANSLHIMGEESVENFFSELPNHLHSHALLLVYGPFKYHGDFTTESNANFNEWLKDRNPKSGIRDFEWVNDLAETAGLALVADNPMPANNQLLVWRVV